MSDDPQTGSTDETPEASKSPEEIRVEIKQTREELGDTVEALGAKTDVKGRASAKADELKASVQEKVSGAGDKAKQSTPSSAQQGGQQILEKVKANPAPLALAGALLLGYLIGRRMGS